jgi:EmrB/QacA subfamily drug resistance transporter
MHRNRQGAAVSTSSPYPLRKWALGVLCLSLLVISLDNTILNTALPKLGRDLHASGSQLQWIVDSYMLVFAGMLLAAGSLGDRYGRRKALVFGLSVFGVGSLLSAASDEASMLIASRALMGLGGAFIMPTTLSILTNVFPAEERGKAIGAWAGVSGLGIVIGPVAGGFLLEHFAWSSVFLVNVPVVALALAGAMWLVPESKDPDVSPLDPHGSVLSMVALSCLLWAIIEAPSYGWTSPSVVVAFSAAAIFGSAFVWWETHTATPMLDLSLLRNRRFSAASFSVTLVFFGLMGTIFVLTQFLQSVLGYSPLQAGLRVMPVAVGVIAGGPASARLAARIGARPLVSGGLVVIAAALLLLSSASPHSSYPLIGGSLALMGIGMGMGMAPATESIMSSLPPANAGVGSAMNDATRQVGGAIGVAVLGSVLSSMYRPQMNEIVAHLPKPLAHTAHDQVSGAVVVAQHLGGRAGADLADAAHAAFASGMDAAALVAAAAVIVGALIAARYMPDRNAAVEAAVATAAPVAQPARA